MRLVRLTCGLVALQAVADALLFPQTVVSEGAGVRSIRDHLAVDNRGPLSWITPLLAQTAATAVLSDLSACPAQYERRVVGFFDRYLLKRVSGCRSTGTRTDDCVTP